MMSSRWLRVAEHRRIAVSCVESCAEMFNFTVEAVLFGVTAFVATTLIRNNDSEIVAQMRDDSVPRVVCCRRAVEEYDWQPLSMLLVGDTGTIRGADVLHRYRLGFIGNTPSSAGYIRSHLFGSRLRILSVLCHRSM